jgi:hypothetical protein
MMANAMNALRAHARKPASEAHGPGAKLAKGGKATGYKKGGPTTDDRMRLGKNMSRAMNQKTG